MSGECRTIDDVRSIIAEVEGRSLLPSKVAKLIVAHQIQVEDGSFQPQFLLIPTPLPAEGRRPRNLYTALDHRGRYAWRPMTADSQGGVLPQIRATGDWRTGTWCIEDPNDPKRFAVGGAGITDDNFRMYRFGIAGWRDDGNGQPVHRWVAATYQHVIENPDQVIGWSDVIENDGTFTRMPYPKELPGHFVSDKRTGHATIGSIPIIGSVLLARRSELIQFPEE